jgi:hypothetical protein
MGQSSSCCEAKAPNNSTDIVTRNLAEDETGPQKPPGSDAPLKAPNGMQAEQSAVPGDPITMGMKFTVVLEKKEGQKLGFGLTRIGETVTVNEIKEDGAIVAYNSENPTKKVQLEDIINSINGSKSSLEDIKTVVQKSSGTLTMEMERPKIWLAALDIPEGGSLGMKLGEPQKVFVPILGVDATGPAADFNAKNAKNTIAAGDFIIKTDQLKKDGPKMLEYINQKKGGLITCTVWRNLPG